MRIPVYEQEVAPSPLPGPHASPLESTTQMLAGIGQAAMPIAQAGMQAHELAQQNNALNQSSKVVQLGNLIASKSQLALGQNIGQGADGTAPWALAPDGSDLKKIGFTDDEISSLQPSLRLSPGGNATYSTYGNTLLRKAQEISGSGLDQDAGILFKRYTDGQVDGLTSQYEKHEVQQVQQAQLATANTNSAVNIDTMSRNAVNPDGTLNTDLIDSTLHNLGTNARHVSSLLGEAAPPVTGSGGPAPGAPASGAAPGASPGSSAPSAPAPSAPAPAPSDLGQERLNQTLSAGVSSLIKSVATTNNSALLQQTYAKYGPLLHGDDAIKMKEFVQGKSDSAQGLGASANVWDQFTAPVGPPQEDGTPAAPTAAQQNPGAHIADMVAALRKQNLTPEALKIAEMDLKDRANLADAQQKAQTTQTEGALWDGVLQGHGAGWVTQQPEFQTGLDGNGRAAFLSKVTAYQAQRQGGTDTATQLQQQAKLFDIFTEMNQDPGGPAGWLKSHEVNGDGGEKYLMTLAPQVGAQGVSSLLKSRYDAMNPTQGKPFPVMPEAELHGQVQEAWTSSGLVKADPSPDQKAQMNNFVSYLQRKMQGAGHLWDLDSTQALIKEKSQDVVTGHGLLGGEKKQPFWQAEQAVPAWFTRLGQVNGQSNAQSTGNYFDYAEHGAFDYTKPEFKRFQSDWEQNNATKGLPPPSPAQVQFGWFQRQWISDNVQGPYANLNLNAPPPDQRNPKPIKPKVGSLK